MRRHFDVVHDEGDPAAEDEHPLADHGGGVKGAGQRRHSAQLRLRPGHRVDVEDPEIGEAAARHPAVDNEPGVGAVLVGVGGGGVGFAGRRRLPVAAGDVPLHRVGVGPDLQGVEVVQVAGDVVLRILANKEKLS